MSGSPYGFPNQIYITVCKLPFEVQQKPSEIEHRSEFLSDKDMWICLPVAKIEMAEVSIVLNGFIQSLIQNLNQGSHIGKVLIHLVTIWKIAEYQLNCYVSMFSYTL